MRKVEFLLAILLAMAFMLHYKEVPGARVLLIFSIAVLIAFYLITGVGLSRRNLIFYAWRHTPIEDRPALMIRTLSGIVFAGCLVAVGFNELFIKHFDILTGICIAFLTTVMFFSMFLLENEHPELNRAILWRSALFSAALLYYAVVPLQKQISWHYDDIYYRELLLFAIEHPEDEKAQKDLHAYESRMRGITLPE